MYGFDFGMFLKKIFESLTDQPMVVRIGFSFLMKKQKDQDLVYIYESKSLAQLYKLRDQVNINKISVFEYFKVDAEQLVVKYQNKSYQDLLMETYVAQEEDNVFTKSGLDPFKLICSYIWIYK